MANIKTSFHELRFDVRDPDITHVYVYINNDSGEFFPGIQGWHYKAFPARVSAMDILNEIGKGDAPVMWPMKAPD